MSILPSPSPVKKNPEISQQTKTGDKKSLKGGPAVKAKIGVVAKPPAPSKVSDKRPQKDPSRKIFRKNPSDSKSGASISLTWRLVLSGILAAAFLAGAFFSHGQLKTLVRQIEEKRSQWVALSERDLSLENLSQDLNKVEDQIPLIANAFPDEQMMIDFFNQVERLEVDAQVAVTAFSFTNDEPRVDEADNSYLEFSMEAIGEAANLKRFFEMVFNLPILMKVRTVSFEDLGKPDSRLLFQSRVYVDSDFYSRRGN